MPVTRSHVYSYQVIIKKHGVERQAMPVTRFQAYAYCLGCEGVADSIKLEAARYLLGHWSETGLVEIELTQGVYRTLYELSPDEEERLQSAMWYIRACHRRSLSLPDEVVLSSVVSTCSRTR